MSEEVRAMLDWVEKHSASFSGVTTFGKAPTKSGLGSEFSGAGRRVQGIMPAIKPVRSPKAPTPGAGAPARTRKVLPVSPAQLKPPTSGELTVGKMSAAPAWLQKMITRAFPPPAPVSTGNQVLGAFGQGVKRIATAPWRAIPASAKKTVGAALVLGGAGLGVAGVRRNVRQERQDRQGQTPLAAQRNAYYSSLWR